MAVAAGGAKRTLELRYEMGGTHANSTVAFKSNTVIGALVDYIKTNKKVSDIAVYSGEEPLDPTKTFGDYNIGEGASLTVKKFYVLPPTPPSEDEAD